MHDDMKLPDDQHLPEVQAALVPSLFDPSRAFTTPDPLPLIPTMVATRLQLDLLLQDSPIDLRAVSEVILADPGATLLILRLVGQECPDKDGRPTRIEDCLATLSVELWYQTICASGISHDGALLGEWHKHRRVAQCARELAKQGVEFSPEEAYLVALLCRLGSFPQLLGWEHNDTSSSGHAALGIMLADYWHLPAYLLTAIRDQHNAEGSSRWSGILHAAHQLAQQAESAPACDLSLN